MIIKGDKMKKNGNKKEKVSNQPKEEKTPAAPVKSGSAGWIIAGIILLAIVAFLIFRSGNNEVPKIPDQTSDADKTLTTDKIPMIDKKCIIEGTPTGPTIGVVPEMTINEDGKITVAFKNNGRADIESTYLAFSDGKNTRWMLSKDPIKMGTISSFTVDLNKVSTELGARVTTFILYPTLDGKACQNGAEYVIGRD